MSQPASTIQAQAALPRRGSLHAVLVSMRPHQWTKNLFALAPLLFGQKLGDIRAVGSALLAFAVFCLIASALYIVNDITDAEADRAHPEKRFRPIASGELAVSVAILASVVLLGMSFGIAVIISWQFLALAIGYGMLTFGYSLAVKHVVILDCMTIATGFVLRVVGGAAAVKVTPTHWLIVCAFLLALYLAFVKRRQELMMLTDTAREHRQVLSQYSVTYLEQVNNILVGATIVCYTLYTVAPETVARFGTDKLIYGTVFVLYGMLRYMVLTQKAENGGNPSRMLVSDKPLMLAILGWGIFNALVIYRGVLAALWERIV
ncbi:MAG TPA: decaprenyl-phosphate phosphoribosyltransferase [Blastocatellia bacterium]|nr:decaprenyl-phosphate phosphoribosyltransferase [Blastocatellia bacterium]